MLSEIPGEAHALETQYPAAGVSEAARHSGGEEADARKPFRGWDRGHEQVDTDTRVCRDMGDSVSKPRQRIALSIYRVEVEARGIYHDEVEARGVTGSAADHEERGSNQGAGSTRCAGGATAQIACGSTRRHTRPEPL